MRAGRLAVASVLFGLLLFAGATGCRLVPDDPAGAPFVKSGLIAADGSVTVYFERCVTPSLVAVVDSQWPKDEGPFVATLEPISSSAPPISRWTIGDPPNGYRESVEVDRISSRHNLALSTGAPGVGNQVVGVSEDVLVPRGSRTGGPVPVATTAAGTAPTTWPIAVPEHCP